MSGRRTTDLLPRGALIRMITTAALAAAMAAFPAAAMAAEDGSGGSGHGGSGGMGEETSIPNNLSFPTIWSDGAPLAAPYVQYPAGEAPAGTLDPTKLTVSVPDPANPGGILYPQGAADPPGSTSQANFWQAGNVMATAPVDVSQINWGDNIEGTAVSGMLGKPIRVETTLLENLSTPMKGYNMYHISGSKSTEVFGTDGTAVDTYQADVYSACARLTIQRLDISRSDPYVSSVRWDPATGEWTGKGLIAPAIFNGGAWAGSEGSGYSAEINRSGSVVYGYNWRTSGLSAGDYRITFSLESNCPAATLNTHITPETSIMPPSDESATAAAAGAGETGGSGETTGGAVAQIDAADNLSYIDVELGNPSYQPYVPPTPQNTAAPVIGGTAAQDQVLSATTGSWDYSPSSYSYQWQSCDSAGTGCTNIAGATAATYKLTANDVGHTIKVIVTAANENGSASATSDPTGVVVPAAPANRALPTILGSAQPGHALMTTNGSWDNKPTSYAYQWQVCDAAGADCADIAGANAGSYTLTDAMVGHRLRVIVTAFNAGGSSAAASAPTAVVGAQQQVKAAQKTRARVLLHLGWLSGERLHLWGTVYPAHNGNQLMIQQQTRNGWKTVARLRLQKATQERSQYAITLAHGTPGLYRAYLGADQAHVASASYANRARSRSRVTLELQYMTRQRLRLSGSVFPPRNGEKVMVQLRTRSGWKTVATLRLRNATRQRSQYAYTFAHLNPGAYRAYYAGDSAYRAGNSSTITVR